MCPYGTIVGASRAKIGGVSRNYWIVNAEHPECLPRLRGGRTAILDGAIEVGNPTLINKRVLYVNIYREGGHNIAKKWKLLEPDMLKCGTDG